MKLAVALLLVSICAAVVLAEDTHPPENRHHQQQNRNHIDSQDHNKRHQSRKHGAMRLHHSARKNYSQKRAGTNADTEANGTKVEATTAVQSAPSLGATSSSSNENDADIEDLDDIANRLDFFNPFKFLNPIGQILGNLVGSVTCIPTLIGNHLRAFEKELRKPFTADRHLTMTINNKSVYDVILDIDFKICGNPHDNSCKAIPAGILDTVLGLLPFTGLQERVSCIRQIACNVTSAVMDNLSNQSLTAGRQIVFRIDDNVLADLAFDINQPLCPQLQRSAHHHGTDLEEHKKHARSKLKKSKDYDSDEYEEYNPILDFFFNPFDFLTPMGRIIRNMFASIGCIPRIVMNHLKAFENELNKPLLSDRHLTMTINNQVVYDVILDVQLNICSQPNDETCRLIPPGILNAILGMLSLRGLQDRVSCVRHIACNVTSAILDNFISNPLTRRRIVFKIDENVLADVVLDINEPLCPQVKRAHHHATGLEAVDGLHKRHVRSTVKRANENATHEEEVIPFISAIWGSITGLFGGE